MKRLALLLMAAALPIACEKPPATAASAQPVASAAPSKSDACQRDIPDCEAACALRETGRTEHLDWFDRRCAAVVLGRNPDKAVGYVAPEVAPETAPVASGSAAPTPPAGSGSGGPPALPSTRQLPPPAPFDPFAGRGNLPEPVECTAARNMRAKGRTREADVLAALCAAKGGSESKDMRPPDVGF